MKKYAKLIGLLAVFVAAFLLLQRSGVLSQLSLDNIPQLRERFLALGVWAFLAYALLYIFVCLFFLPGLPVTILGGSIFGPLWGTIYTVISASLGLALAFLSARYAVRDLILGRFGNSEAFKKIDAGVRTEGWRILIITRLVPIFPFSIQNYIYGLTNINFLVYWALSTLFIIPGTAAYTLSAGAVTEGSFSPKTLIYLAVGAVCFVFVTLLPKFIKPKE